MLLLLLARHHLYIITMYYVYRVLSRENDNIRTSAKGCGAGVEFRRLLQFGFNEIPVTAR